VRDRLDRAERAIEEERSRVRDLHRKLEEARAAADAGREAACRVAVLEVCLRFAPASVRLCVSVRPSVRPSVRLSVNWPLHPCTAFACWPTQCHHAAGASAACRFVCHRWREGSDVWLASRGPMGLLSMPDRTNCSLVVLSGVPCQ
jgi:hypothetical protein